MRCIVCGTEIPENCAFCPECGVKVESMEAAIPQPGDFSGQAAAATSAEQGEATQHVAAGGKAGCAKWSAGFAAGFL